MEATRFDCLAALVGDAKTRRRVLAGVVGSTLSALLGFASPPIAPVVEAKRKKKKKKKRVKFSPPRSTSPPTLTCPNTHVLCPDGQSCCHQNFPICCANKDGCCPAAFPVCCPAGVDLCCPQAAPTCCATATELECCTAAQVCHPVNGCVLA